MILTTTPLLQGYSINEYLGLVSGETVLRVTLNEAFSAIGQALSGQRRFGHLEEAMRSARQEATALMIEHARKIGAEGIVGVHIDSEVFEGVFAMTVYGTAVRFETTPPPE